MSIHDNKYWSRRVEELATQISPTDDTTFFGSDAYREYTEDAAKNMVSGVCTYLRTLGYDITEKEEDARAANLMVGMSTNKNMTACTDGNFVTVGVCSDIVTYFDSRELKHYAIQGLRVHEIGHVLFTDFPTSARWSSALKNGNWWPNAPKRASETAGAELTQMLKNPDFAPGFEDAVSAIYKDTLGRNGLSKYFSKNSDQDSQGEMAIFVIYLLASPESKLIQNQAKYGLLFTTFEKDANAETAATEQDTILQKYGVPLQRNLFDYTREALIATKKTDISVKGINGDVNARNWFDYESYGFSCRYDTLLSMALHDAGVSEQPALERTITKQKFTDAQKAAAKSVYFTKLDEEHHNIDGGDFFAMIDDETIEMNEDGTIVAEEGAAVPTLALINLYNMLLPMMRSCTVMLTSWLKRLPRCTTATEKSATVLVVQSKRLTKRSCG